MAVTSGKDEGTSGEDEDRLEAGDEDLLDQEAHWVLDDEDPDDLRAQPEDDPESALPVGRLSEEGLFEEDDPTGWRDEEKDAVAFAVDRDETDLSAEEEAVHLTTPPPMGELGDDYIEPYGEQG